jgi:RHS repeat-associated protein
MPRCANRPSLDPSSVLPRPPLGSLLSVTRSPCPNASSRNRHAYWSTFGYDAARRRTAETNAAGIITLNSYCPCGSLDSVTRAYGTPAQEVTTYFYDLQGRLTNSILPDGTSITYTNDPLGQMTGTGDGLFTRTLFYNNHQGLLTRVETPHGDLQRTTYDLEDRPLWVTDANGVTTTNVYDDLGRLTARYWLGGGETNGYTANTNGPTSFTNALGQVTAFAYDPAGRKTYETNANAEVLRYTYNSAGDLLTLTDGRNLTTTWIYDPYGRVTNKLDQSTQEVFRYRYDPNGRLTNRWTPAKGTTTYRYDAVGNLTNLAYPAGTTSITMKYDPLNRLTNLVDAVGTTGFEYHPGGGLAKEDGPWSSDTVTNGYVRGLRYALGLQQPTGWWTNGFIYDLARRLTNVTSPAGTFGYTFGGPAGFAGSLIQKLSLPGNLSITNDFDALARLRGTFLKASEGTNLDYATYGLNAGHQRTSCTNGVGTSVTRTQAFAYDAIGQLKVADSSVNTEDRGYTYDASWNLNYRTNNGALQTFSVDNENQLTSAPYGNTSYDDNGNLISAQEGDQTFSYDAENQLTEVVTALTLLITKKTTLVYDGLNRLRLQREYQWEGNVEESIAPGDAALNFDPGGGGGSWTLLAETRYLYDGWRVIQERNSNNVPTVSYTRGTDLSGSLEGAGGIGGLLARSPYDANSQLLAPSFYFSDGNGNIQRLVNSSGTSQASYRYDPYGNLLSSSGTLAAANVYRFSSKEWLNTPGLYYYGYRYYSPNWQRWVNRDPIAARDETTRSSREVEAVLNLHAFVVNDPISFIDANGLWKWWGNWGGPNWTGGNVGTWEDVVDNGWPVAPPQDNQDKCYEDHDKCHAACRDDFRQCKADGNWKSGKLQLGSCLRKCDRELSRCLKNLGDDPSNNCHARTGSCVFWFLGNFGHTFESDPTPRRPHVQ